MLNKIKEDIYSMARFKSVKNKKNINTNTKKRELPLKDDEQEYARIEKSLGDRRMECVCFDGVTRQGRIRGKIRKRKSTWIKVDDIVLVALRDFNDSNVDIIEKYSADEVRKLIRLGEIPDNVHINEDNDDDENMIIFEEEEEEEKVVNLDAL